MTAWLTLDKVAVECGREADPAGRKFLLRQIKAGRLVAHKFGARVMCRPDDVAEFVAACRMGAAVPEPEPQADTEPAQPLLALTERAARRLRRTA